MKASDYTQINYKVNIEVESSPAEVFNHIINDIGKYWPEEIEGHCSQLDDEFIFTTGDSHYSKNRVVEFVPDKKVIWLVTESQRSTDGYDWTGTKMIFELTPIDSGTLVTFTYDGPVLKNERDRLVQICDMVIKERLYALLTGETKSINPGEQMNNKGHTISIEIAKSPHDVFSAITKDVAKWWGGKDFEGNSSRLNDEFIIHHPGAHFSRQKLVEVIPDQKVVWLVTESKLNWLHDQEEWTNTRMIFEISGSENNTVLHFTHEGLVPEKECYDKCHQGWNMIIKERLFNFIIEGKESLI